VNGILLSFAHPDDETVLAAGVACKYSAAGVDIVVSTATRGEVGKRGDPPVCSVEELPAVREAELRAAASIVGIRDVTFLGYRDRELAAAPPEEIREKLVRLLRARRPRIVITFDPNGSNLHPDHVAISRFTTDAVVAAADSRWFPDAGEAHRVARLLWSPPQRPWQLMRMPEFPRLPGVDYAVDVAAWASRKAEALRAHRSQHQSLDRIFFSQPDVDRLLSMELFRQALGPSLRAYPGNDLFEGL